MQNNKQANPFIEPPATELDCSAYVDLNGKIYDIITPQSKSTFASRGTCQADNGDFPTFKNKKDFDVVFNAKGNFNITCNVYISMVIHYSSYIQSWPFDQLVLT